MRPRNDSAMTGPMVPLYSKRRADEPIRRTFEATDADRRRRAARKTLEMLAEARALAAEVSDPWEMDE